MHVAILFQRCTPSRRAGASIVRIRRHPAVVSVLDHGGGARRRYGIRGGALNLRVGPIRRVDSRGVHQIQVGDGFDGQAVAATRHVAEQRLFVVVDANSQRRSRTRDLKPRDDHGESVRRAEGTAIGRQMPLDVRIRAHEVDGRMQAARLERSEERRRGPHRIPSTFVRGWENLAGARQGNRVDHTDEVTVRIGPQGARSDRPRQKRIPRQERKP